MTGIQDTQENRRILVVDDDPVGVLILCDALDQHYDVATATSGEEALASFEAKRPDLILLDVVMDGMDGFEVCSVLRSAPGGNTLPVVMLTALDDVQSIERAYLVGATDFILKPVNAALVRYRVRYLLRAHDTLRVLDQRERQLATAQRIAQLGHWEYNPHGARFRLSPAARELLGLPDEPTEHSKQSLLDIVHDRDRPLVDETLNSLTRQSNPIRFEHRLRHSGRVVTQVAERHNEHGDCWLGTVQDVTAMRRSAQRIVRLAYYDRNTGLPNRDFFTEHLQRLLDSGETNDISVLVIEIEALRRVGVGWGEAVAAPLLRGLCARIMYGLSFELPRAPLESPPEWSAAERPMLARLSDSALAVLPKQGGAESIDLARRLLSDLGRPLHIAGIDLRVEAQIGIAHFSTQGGDAETLLRQATAAVRDASQAIGRIRIYEQRHEASERNRIALEAGLQRAIDNNELELWYQPKVDVRTGLIVGAEGLVRWRDPNAGLISPARFIPLAEETGLIVPLSDRVLDIVCADLAVMRETDIPLICLSVNISAAQLDHESLADEIADRLTQVDISPGYLELEITERALMPRVESVLGTLHALHALGVSLALDDFGTGYSSLGYLGRFPLDILKIDRSFVTDLGSGAAGESVVRAIVALAKGLDLGVIAEGIETRAQADWLEANHCHLHQGYLYGRPMERGAFLNLLTQTPTEYGSPCDADSRKAAHC